MPNKTIPELPEIDLEDLSDTDLLVWETGSATWKVRASTLKQFLFGGTRTPIEVVLASPTSGEIEVDVSADVVDARYVQWLFKKPLGGSTNGEQMPAATITTPDADTVIVNVGEYSIDAGTYLLLGV